ncbi:glycosyltransferase family A protein [Cellulomonas hominis]
MTAGSTGGADRAVVDPPPRVPLRVVVVVPCLDDADFLATCLEALAHQTRQPDEVLVVDNGSTDGSREVARRAGVTLTTEPRRGIWPAAAHGYDCAVRTADVIARLDADSVPPTDWVERVATAFEQDPGLDALTGAARFYGAGPLVRHLGEHLYIGGMYAVLTPVFGHPPVFGSNFAMRAGLWLRVRHLVASDDPLLHDDLDLSIRFPAGTRVRYDRTLVMPVSARPFASRQALGLRLRKALWTFQRSWPAGAPWVKRARAPQATAGPRDDVRTP